MVVPSEDQECVAFAKWMRARGLCFAHIPNGGRRSASEAAKFQRMGVSPGVPDFLIFEPVPVTPGLVGVALEMKRRRGGRVSAFQQAWLDHLGSRCRFHAAVCFGAKEAITLMQRLGYDGLDKA